jgi:hypothetical protein
MSAQLLHDLVAVRLVLHVDEVDDDDAADIAQAELAGDLAGRVEVGAEDRLLRIFLAGVAAGVDVDGDEPFGRLDDDVTAGGQLDLAVEGADDLLLDVVLVEEGRGRVV